jgi:hypothetical protein
LVFKNESLAPTSIGTIATFMADTNKIFNIENLYESEVFESTLEDEGGSEFPALEKIYTLGAVVAATR